MHLLSPHMPHKRWFIRTEEPLSPLGLAAPPSPPVQWAGLYRWALLSCPWWQWTLPNHTYVSCAAPASPVHLPFAVQLYFTSCQKARKWYWAQHCGYVAAGSGLVCLIDEIIIGFACLSLPKNLFTDCDPSIWASELCTPGTGCL